MAEFKITSAEARDGTAHAAGPRGEYAARVLGQRKGGDERVPAPCQELPPAGGAIGRDRARPDPHLQQRLRREARRVHLVQRRGMQPCSRFVSHGA